MDNLPCPCCDSNDLAVHSRVLARGEIRAFDLEGKADPLNRVDWLECLECGCNGPAENWNRRPDPWRYPPDMPEDGQKILFTYMHPETGESQAITAVYSNVKDWHPIVRWMPVPEAS